VKTVAKLYLVATPIGNLGDLSVRAARVLEQADFIAAEDTRVTRKLLSHLGISKPMISYYEHNLRERGEMIVGRIAAGETCALVTDAGMPAISDPGEDLVRLCAAQGIEVIVVPGPCAATAALALSGLSTARYCFEGFLTINRRGRHERLLQLKDEQRTIIFYEAPHKLKKTLADMAEAFGENRRISVARELTKMYEEVLRTTLSGAISHFDKTAPRGEFVLVVEGTPEPSKSVPDLQAAVEKAQQLVGQGESLPSAARLAAEAFGCKKNEVYRRVTENNGKTQP
jgi:16S rRNA (cytidine1402-2'-O)-methyltransferase